jgi:hypothetical protein
MVVIGVGFGAACGTSQSSLRTGSDDPRAGMPASRSQPPPPPPSVTAEGDPNNVEQRFPYREGRAHRESLQQQAQSTQPDRSKIVLDAEKRGPTPAITPAAYQPKAVPDAGAQKPWPLPLR